MSHRPLALVFGLTFGDYLLWSWSLGGSHDILALVSGLTLPPLAVACLWLLALSVARLIASTARRPNGRLTRGRIRRQHQRERERERRTTVKASVPGTPTAAASTDTPSRKLAA